MKQTVEHTIWVINTIYNMGQKRRMQPDAGTENTSGPHDESPCDDSSSGPLVFSVFASTCIFGFEPLALL